MLQKSKNKKLEQQKFSGKTEQNSQKNNKV